MNDAREIVSLLREWRAAKSRGRYLALLAFRQLCSAATGAYAFVCLWGIILGRLNPSGLVFIIPMVATVLFAERVIGNEQK
jgi:hypothetical protein